MEPIVEWGEATANPAPCVRTWLLQETILEEGSDPDWRQKTPSPAQMPTSKMRQMELNFGQRLKGVDLEVDSNWKSGKTATGKLTKKEMIVLASTNQK